ncbi:Neuropeptide receptor A21, partial [Operophtera brumata]
MDHAGNNITLYNDGVRYPSELTLHREFSTTEKTLESFITWPIEKCLKAFFINDTKIDDVTNHIYVYNGTQVMCLEHAPVLSKSTVIRASVLSAMAVLSFFGNLATIISIRRGKRGRGRARPSWTAIYSLIFQLSVADLLVTVFCIAGEAAWSFAVQWYAGNYICKLFKFLQMFALYLSTFILVLIGVDRWLAVKYPMKSMGTATRSGKLVILAWVLSVILSIPQAVIFSEAKGPFVEEFYQCVTHGFYTERWQEQAYTTLSLIFMFLLPLVILSQKVFKPEVRRPAKPQYFSPDMNRRRLIDRAKMKSLRMSVVIVVAFLLWWTPYYVMMLIFTFWNPDKNVKSQKVFKPEVRRPAKPQYFSPDMNRRRLIDRAKMKSLRMSVVIVVAFLLWWTPYYVMMLIFTFWNPDKNADRLYNQQPSAPGVRAAGDALARTRG